MNLSTILNAQARFPTMSVSADMKEMDYYHKMVNADLGISEIHTFTDADNCIGFVIPTIKKNVIIFMRRAPKVGQDNVTVVYNAPRAFSGLGLVPNDTTLSGDEFNWLLGVGCTNVAERLIELKDYLA